MTTSDYLTQLQQDREDLVDNLETMGITGLSGDETFTELVPEILNIPSGSGGEEAIEKDVNFYDYDGKRVYSYTKAEFLLLESMPDNPTHTGLTAQGWNWSLADAKTYVTDYTKLNIGQMYITDDGKTRIYVRLEKNMLSPYVGFAVNGTATINWGDGTTDTITGTSISTVINTQHNYSSEGDYVITLSSESSIYLWGHTSYGSYLLWGNLTTTNENNKYQNAINKIELGSPIDIREYPFQNCSSLKYITMPNYITTLNYG